METGTKIALGAVAGVAAGFGAGWILRERRAADELAQTMRQGAQQQGPIVGGLQTGPMPTTPSGQVLLPLSFQYALPQPRLPNYQVTPGGTGGAQVITGITVVPANDGGYSAALQPYVNELARLVLSQPGFQRANPSSPIAAAIRFNSVFVYTLQRWPDLVRVYQNEPITTFSTSANGPAWEVVLRSSNVQLPVAFAAISAQSTPLRNYTAHQNFMNLLNRAAQQL